VSTVDRHSLPADMRWVDDAGLGSVTLVEPPGNNAGASVEQMLWNTSISRVTLVPKAAVVDSHANDLLHVVADGTLVSPAGPVDGPVRVDRGRKLTPFAEARLECTTMGSDAALFDLCADRPACAHRRSGRPDRTTG
jgi:hypothetical protein